MFEYVVMHEPVHLVEVNYGPRFCRPVGHYPLTARARRYLIGVGLEELEG